MIVLHLEKQNLEIITMPRPETSSRMILKRLDNMELMIEWIADEMLRTRHE